MHNRKLFYFAPTFYPSATGFGVAFSNIIQFIVESGHFDRIIIITTDRNAKLPKSLENDCEIYTFNLRGIRSLSTLPQALSKLALKLCMKDIISSVKSKKPTSHDVFFYEEFHIAYMKFIFESIYPTSKHFIRVHGTFPEFTKHYKKLRKRMGLFKQGTNSKTKRIVTTTNFYIDYINKYYFHESFDKIQVTDYYLLPNALNHAFLEKRHSGTSNNIKLRIFQLGRMDDRGYFQKGFEDSIKALLYIESLNSEIASQIKFTVVGDGNCSSRFKSRLTKLESIETTHLSKADNVQIQTIIEESDIILLPSRCEGMSMFATEAIYKGKALIFTANNGLRDYLKDGINGLQVQEYDYTEIADAIMKYFLNRELITLHGKNNFDLSAEITKKTRACIDVIFKN